MQTIVIFDGVCNLCSGSVRILLKHDKKGVFHYAWLQSETGKALCLKYGIDPDKEDSMVLIYNEKGYTRSTAALLLCKLLGGGWRLFYPLIIVPKIIRDAVYVFIARHRYRWFGKKKECELPDARYRTRFLI